MAGQDESALPKKRLLFLRKCDTMQKERFVLKSATNYGKVGGIPPKKGETNEKEIAFVISGIDGVFCVGGL
jgi:hypothetical protein